MERERVTLLVPTLGGGGAERVMVRLANALARRGVDVDLLVFTSEGPFKRDVAPEVELVDLGTVRARATVPALVRYLRRRRPTALLSTHDRANVLAVVARRLAGVPTRVLVRQASTFSEHVRDAFGRAAPFVPPVVRWAYLRADLVIAVSEGVGRDLVERLRLPEAHVTVVGNPMVTPELQRQTEVIPDEPWLSAGEPP